MATVVGVPAENQRDERRVALVPAAVARLVAGDFRVLVESGCGSEAGFGDEQFAKAGAEVVDAAELYARARVIVCVSAAQRSSGQWRGQIVLGMLQPWRHPALIEYWVRRGITMLSLDLLPPIPQARRMDAATVQARIAGRQAALLAEEHFGGSFPMIAPDGAVRPVRLLVLGAGTIGLQAMSTARLLGADVTGYTGRADGPAVIASSGGRLLELGSPLVAENGARRELGEQERRARRHALDIRIGQFDAVITAAGTPGRRPPRLVSPSAIAGMRPGSVVVDVAASRYGGNVAGSRPNSVVTSARGVRVIGAGNLPSRVPGLASEYYADSVTAALSWLCATGEPVVDTTDPVGSVIVLGQHGRVNRAVAISNQRQPVESR
jgi:NAD(P) transhydrogenase subunit alpha